MYCFYHEFKFFYLYLRVLLDFVLFSKYILQNLAEETLVVETCWSCPK